MPRTRKLAAIMFTDMQGYTALMQQDEQRAVATREKHRRVFQSITAEYGGRILQYFGDGTLSIFDSAIDAVRCAIKMQVGFREPPEVPVRIGIHTGDILLSKEEIIGDSVNIASRIESLAMAGSVLVSDKVYDDLKNQADVDVVFLRAARLKNVANPVNIYAIAAKGLVVPPPDVATYRPGSDISRFSAPAVRAEAPAVVATKLHIPAPRAGLVPRPQLTALIDRGQHGKLTLVCAPAGFGKTTLVSAWISRTERPSAWLSLDEGDNDPVRFLSHFIAGIQKVAPALGNGVLDLIRSHQSPPVESVMAELINEIAAIPDPFNFVLDDYHVIQSDQVNGMVVELLEQNLPQLHLIMTTREDPRLPLPRMRVRNQVNEIRQRNLRFTVDEAGDFFNEVMQLHLSEEDVRALESRTEGWVAGLQLAALSLKGRSDVAGFIGSFSGDDRYVLDYLAEEVLQNQPESIRTFLLQTSVLERLCAPLCNAVTDRDDATEVLHALDRSNLFLIALDDVRYWYRYHHLFAEMLRTKLEQAMPGQVTLLHRRAGGWYEQNDMLREATHHAFKSGDYEWAAGLIERMWPLMERILQEATWLGLARALPEPVMKRMPVLSANFAWALLDVGDIETGEVWIRRAERLLEARQLEADSGTGPTKTIVADEAQYRALPGTIANVRAYLAQARGDTASTVHFAERALELLPPDDHIRRGTPMILLGLVSWVDGDLDRAYKRIREAFSEFEKSGNLLFAIGGTFLFGDIRSAQGRLSEAEDIYKSGLQAAAQYGKSLEKITMDLHLGLAILYNERGDHSEAARQLTLARADGDQHIFIQYRGYITRARVHESSGDYDSAMEALREAQRLHIRSPMPDLQPVAGLIARVQTRLGRYREAMVWAKEEGLEAGGPTNYLTEFGHMVLARALISRYRAEEDQGCLKDAVQLLERLLQAAEEGGRNGSAIEVLVLLAMAYEAQGRMDAALKVLRKAFVLGEPEGYLRVFADEGRHLAALLAEAREQHIFPEYADKVLTEIDVGRKGDT